MVGLKTKVWTYIAQSREEDEVNQEMNQLLETAFLHSAVQSSTPTESRHDSGGGPLTIPVVQVTIRIWYKPNES